MIRDHRAVDTSRSTAFLVVVVLLGLLAGAWLVKAQAALPGYEDPSRTTMELDSGGPAVPAQRDEPLWGTVLPHVYKVYRPPKLPVAPDPAAAPYVLAVLQLPAGSHPHGIALDLDGQRAFVGNHLGNSLTVIDTAAMAVGSTYPLSGADGPNGVAYHAGHDRVYVANRNSNNVSVVDPASGAVVASPAAGSMPDGVAVHGELAYVANFASHDVSVVDARTNEVTRTLSLPWNSEPSLVAGGDDRGVVYVSLHGLGQVYYVQDGQIVNASPPVSAPYGLAFDPVYARLYVAGRGAAQSVAMIDTDYNSVIGHIAVGQEPYVVGVNPRTGHVFVVAGDRVRVYDRRDQALVADIPVGPGAEEGVAVDPCRNLVYVTSGDADQVTVIQDIPTLDLAYVSRDAAGAHLVVIDQTAHHTDVITSCPACTLLDSAWRPDGRRLAFSSSLSGDLEIWTIGAGGQSPLNLTNEPAVDDSGPAWSPDGTHIAWQRGDEIWVMDADGGNRRRASFDLAARTACWSPDGAWIAFVAYAVGGHEDLFIVPAEGDDPINLTQHAAVDLGPSWSPDSQWLAFESDRQGDYSLYKIGIASYPTVTQLTQGPAPDHSAAWSPDGEAIAYISDAGGSQYDYALWQVVPDGSVRQRLSVAIKSYRPMSWSTPPDSGRWLAVQGGLFDYAEIYAFDLDAWRSYRLTTNAVQDEAPVWRPDHW